jgi:hypothetical protein
VRILTAVRRLDEATTLRGILDALADGAASENLRLAVLLVDQSERGELRVYRHHGCRPAEVPAHMAISSSVAMSQAVVKCQRVAMGAGPTPDPSTPSFLRVAPGRSGLILPLVVDRSAVALVFVEGPADTLQWGDVVEVLVRHGSARLESVTSQRTVEVLTASF